LLQIPEVKSVGRRAGRAERDDHVMPVSVNEFDVEFHEGGRPREEVFAEIRKKLTIPAPSSTSASRSATASATCSAAFPPRSPSKSTARISTRSASLGRAGPRPAKAIPGLTDVNLEAQVPIPQIRIEVDRARAQADGLAAGRHQQQVSALLGGNPRRTPRRRNHRRSRPPPARNGARRPERLGDLLVETPTGGADLPLSLVADVVEVSGPNVINREGGQRRIVIGANTSERDLESLVQRWQQEVAASRSLCPRATRCASRANTSPAGGGPAHPIFSACWARASSAAVWDISAAFRSPSRSCSTSRWPSPAPCLHLVLIDNISIATLVGFIAVGGVAARNGIMMISHYLHLMRHEGEGFGAPLITRGTQERLVPVLMTALSAGIALIPLVLAPANPARKSSTRSPSPSSAAWSPPPCSTSSSPPPSS
jgi:Cu/Ag efflux pump CusA